MAKKYYIISISVRTDVVSGRHRRENTQETEKEKNMSGSDVYFTSFKATGNENLLQKLHRLMKTAGFENIDFKDKFTAIKIHFGEYGNIAFLRPNYARVVADYVKELGGKTIPYRL